MEWYDAPTLDSITATCIQEWKLLAARLEAPKAQEELVIIEHQLSIRPSRQRSTVLRLLQWTDV